LFARYKHKKASHEGEHSFPGASPNKYGNQATCPGYISNPMYPSGSIYISSDIVELKITRLWELKDN
jgi:hypothetical protein